RRGMAAEADRYPDVVEAPPCDEREIPGLNHAAPIAFVRRFQPIAEVDALLEMSGRSGRNAEDERLGSRATPRRTTTRAAAPARSAAPAGTTRAAARAGGAGAAPARTTRPGAAPARQPPCGARARRPPPRAAPP